MEQQEKYLVDPLVMGLIIKGLSKAPWEEANQILMALRTLQPTMLTVTDSPQPKAAIEKPAGER